MQKSGVRVCPVFLNSQTNLRLGGTTEDINEKSPKLATPGTRAAARAEAARPAWEPRRPAREPSLRQTHYYVGQYVGDVVAVRST